MGKEILLVGIGMLLTGIALILITSFHPAGLIYGIIIGVIGLILIFFNKEEDKIEKRRDKK